MKYDDLFEKLVDLAWHGQEGEAEALLDKIAQADPALEKALGDDLLTALGLGRHKPEHEQIRQAMHPDY